MAARFRISSDTLCESQLQRPLQSRINCIPRFQAPSDLLESLEGDLLLLRHRPQLALKPMRSEKHEPARYS